MSKSLLFGLALGALPFLAQAQYMGLDQVPVSNSDANKVFLTAVQGRDFQAINAWKDKITQKYDQTGFCAFASGYGNPATKVNKDILGNGNNSDNIENFIENQYVSVVPSNCDNVSLWSLYNKLGNGQYSYDIYKSAGELSKLKQENIPAADTYEKNTDIVLSFLNNIPDDKYQLFLPLIFQNDTDFKVRNLAFDKFIEGKKDSKNAKVDPNDIGYQLQTAIKQAVDNKAWVDTFDDKTYMSYFQPDLLILTEMNKKALDTLYIYWDIYKERSNVMPPFTEEVIAKGGYTDQELQNMHLDSLSQIELYRLYNTNQVIRLFHKAFENYVKDGNDLNVQKDDGNTMLTQMMLDRKYRLSYSPFAGSFIRFYLENGANPLLQNKNGDTAFSAFMKNYGDDSASSEVKKAFVEKQYHFNFKEVHVD